MNIASLFKMSGRGGIYNSLDGCDRVSATRGGCSRGQGKTYIGSPNAAKRGMCTNLDTNVFDYGQKFAADQM
jgi:hypothetical protein